MARSPTARIDDVDAVTFDFYNTLVYHRGGEGRGRSLMGYLAAQGLRSDPWEHQVLYDLFARHGEEYAPRLSDGAKRRYHERLAERLFQRLRVRAPHDTAARHASEIWRRLGPDSLAVFPEVPAVLGALRRAGYRLAVISNWQCGLRHFCTELGLGAAFDHVLASAEVGWAKPDAGIFVEACRRLGVVPPRVLHVGDSPEEDVGGARAAGLRAVLLDRTGARLDPHAAISSLQALPEILGSRSS